jgi:prepilin-type N-terminal cleavage/methylation domain-containing protein
MEKFSNSSKRFRREFASSEYRTALPLPRQAAFTLIELLIAIAIIAILATVVILTINPAELLKQARDANRLSDLANLNHAVAIFQTDNPLGSIGAAFTTYLSLMDPTATTTAGTNCEGIASLPSLPAPWNYHCSASSTLRMTNGTGWMPVNFSLNSSASPLSILPIDPTNSSSSRFYYTYATNGTGYEMTAITESQKYQALMASDGGSYDGLYQKGNSLDITPPFRSAGLVGYWPMDEGSGSVANDASGSNGNGTWSGTPAGTSGYYSAGKVGGWAGTFNNVNDFITVPNTLNEANLNQQWTVSAWVNIGSAAEQVLLGYNSGLKLNHSTTNKLLEYLNSNTDDYYDYGNYNLQDGVWHFVVFVFRNSDGLKQIYVDNNNVALAGPNLTSKPSGILSSVKIGSGVLGRIDDLRIYSRALSSAEISALYNATK